MRAGAFLPVAGALLALSACHHDTPPPAGKAALGVAAHYVLENPYQKQGVWYYPREDFAYESTGLAAVSGRKPGERTADGELYNPDSMTGAHQTLQLPCIMTVRNIENGREVTLRLNDRGPSHPGRIIALTPRVAALLGMKGNEPAKVSLKADEAASRALLQLVAGVPRLDIRTAPVGAVQQQDLGGGQPVARPQRETVVSSQKNPSIRPLPDLPQIVRQTYSRYGTLWIDAGRFHLGKYAKLRAARVGGQAFQERQGGLDQWVVRVGPFADTAAADERLSRLLASGVGGLRIVIK